MKRIARAGMLFFIFGLWSFPPSALADEKTVTVEVPVHCEDVMYEVMNFYVATSFTVGGKAVLVEKNFGENEKGMPVDMFDGTLTLKLKPTGAMPEPGTKIDYVCILIFNKGEGLIGNQVLPAWIYAVPKEKWEAASVWAFMKDYPIHYTARQDGTTWTTKSISLIGGHNPGGVVGVDGTIEFQPDKTMKVNKIVMFGMNGKLPPKDYPEELFTKKKFKAFKVDKKYVTGWPLRMTGTFDQWAVWPEKAAGAKSGQKSMERAVPGATQVSTQPETRAAPTNARQRIMRVGGAVPQLGAAPEQEEIR